MVAIKFVKNAFKGAYVGVFALFDSLLISYPQHFKSRWKGPSKAYKVIKVPKGYKDDKLEPEFREVPSGGYSSRPKDDNTAAGFAGLNF